jgi:hypothetical protein
VLLSTLVLRKHFRDKSEHGPPKYKYTVIHCWQSELSSVTSTCVFRPFKHSTLPSNAQNLQKHIWSPNLIISPCTLVSPLKKPYAPWTLTRRTTHLIYYGHTFCCCSHVTEYYYYYSGALSYFLEELIICFLLFLLILCYSYQLYITSNLHHIEIFC